MYMKFIYLCNPQNYFFVGPPNGPYCPLGLTQVSHSNMVNNILLILIVGFYLIQNQSEFQSIGPNQMANENSQKREGKWS